MVVVMQWLCKGDIFVLGTSVVHWLILNINTRICIHSKQQTAQKRRQSGMRGTAGFAEADFTRFE